MENKPDLTRATTTYAVIDIMGKYLTENGFTSNVPDEALKLNTHAEAFRLALLYNADVTWIEKD